ncbi:histidine decarboxylase [Micromonospora sp. NPDC048170]|uniref:histidine decarboxylase n=1 Tax=Micromonospora sp. NPDC048170 TaxID=3154819 RepID=UPI0033C49732
MSGPRVDLEAAADLGQSPIDVAAVIQTLADQAAQGQAMSIGFPGAVDIDYRAVAPLHGRLWNNIGDPATEPGGAAHTKALERAVIAWCADAVALPADNRWGYVTAGGTEGNLAALHAAHVRYPTGVVYYSAAAHYSIRKIIEIVGVRSVVVDATDTGEMSYPHLASRARRNRQRPAIVVATAGTTMTEAIDNTSRIHAVLSDIGIDRRHVHVDAALAGIPLALDGALRLDDASGVDSVAISGHKFFGTPTPCGVVLMRDSIRRHGTHIAYTGTLDTTVAGSRCGQAAAMLWYAIASHGREGHRWRATAARQLAADAVDKLTAVGWPAWRHPHAFTVVLRTPPELVRQKWLLATDGDWSHTICMPGISRAQIDAFVADIAAAVRWSPPAAIPRPRSAAEPTSGQHQNSVATADAVR